jgi:hypothetical protein
MIRSVRPAPERICIRCRELPAADETGLCVACGGAVRTSVESGFATLNAYLSTGASTGSDFAGLSDRELEEELTIAATRQRRETRFIALLDERERRNAAR